MGLRFGYFIYKTGLMMNPLGTRVPVIKTGFTSHLYRTRLYRTQKTKEIKEKNQGFAKQTIEKTKMRLAVVHRTKFRSALAPVFETLKTLFPILHRSFIYSKTFKH